MTNNFSSREKVWKYSDLSKWLHSARHSPIYQYCRTRQNFTLFLTPLVLTFDLHLCLVVSFFLSLSSPSLSPVLLPKCDIYTIQSIPFAELASGQSYRALALAHPSNYTLFNPIHAICIVDTGSVILCPCPNYPSVRPIVHYSIQSTPFAELAPGQSYRASVQTIHPSVQLYTI